ncbi:DUF1883 domain-containing protein [Pseudomonas asplenii]|uniref:DUF1883 domain-containing protein n=1 Tax=Pseudomonas asplenii TaxID=53407 RepID=UPI002234D19E|nr:DUF1883 domain-containing protein [Pseudomonas asplenii]UZE27018.1 DUF1883 domain-containing protein [Pseudomonas asplenii]
MKFTHYDLKNCQRGQTVEVTLEGNAANVLLLDSINFQNYKNGREYKYSGGHMTTSISRLPIPHAGHWHVVIDLGGYAGSVRSSVRVI